MPTETTTVVQSSAQYRAVAWLRWRIFLNQFRRKGSKGDLLARFITIPFAAVVLIGPTIAAGFGAGYFAHTGQLEHIAWILWGAFIFCQFLNIQLGQPGTTFDPTQLIRFPLSPSNYIAIRLFFGLLAPANISAVCIALAVATGITVVLPQLWAYTFFALFLFAAANVLFSRMLFAWIDRWLSTRRAREIFTAFIFIGSLGFQWVNLTINPAYSRHSHNNASAAAAQQKLNVVSHLYQHVLPWIAGLPPNLTASSLQAAQNASHLRYLIDVLCCALYSAVFYAIFAWRTSIEYRGENLSDQANAVAKPAAATRSTAPAIAVSLRADLSPTPAGSSTTSQDSMLGLLMGKEFLTIRRNTGLFYGLIAPIVLVFIFAFKMGTGNRYPWIFPVAAAYALMGIVPLAYNAFGLEGAGVQFHFLAPVPMRTIILSKNLMTFALAALDLILVFVVISYVSAVPSLRMTIVAILWAAAMLFLSLTIGNRRSITAPKKIEPGRSASKQASPLSSLISFAILLTGACVGGALYLAEQWYAINWLLVPVITAAAVAAFIVYRRNLDTIDQYAFDNREKLFAELCKQ